ncbi:hypothetical protein SD70_29310 [Gordoniibacillus kamchatkensis]|uniref:Apea-like HEPN domain-containing protein n=1 Tax=Gordoniibacillus kamchatkensis TaxID=1590651 RepID=A0ABR5AAK7_9BACL|nr:hypothetical protein [Paenibacillus sp. VKM B-2647]KIL38000.1 hypothetical protein SD70_29310 [Paenibacillus sp. VKM B-2647]
MSRAVTADHVMFNECIPMFRPDNLETKTQREEQVGYLFLDFSLQQPLEFTYFSIQPTIEVRLPGAYAAFVAPVILPKWFEMHHNVHLFSIALSAVISFVTGRPIKAPRDGYASRRQQLDEYTLSELAVQHPILTAGPGAHDIRLSQVTFEKISSQLKESIQLLFDLPYDLYIKTMQSIRLVHLAHLIKREDFGLGYYLLISAMEPIATSAIKRKAVAPQHTLHDQWKEIAKTNSEFEPLFKAYQQEVGKNKHIGKRFVEFVMKYCPPDQWGELEHPQENSMSYSSEIIGDAHDWSWVTKKRWYEIYPEDLTEEEIRKLLTDCYDHRSRFTHEGKNPPHRTPDSHNRFFDKETVVDYDEKTEEFQVIYEVVLPNFRLISFIAKRSILNFLREKVGD